MTGLQSDWVQKPMRRSWNRIGMWEKRMFTDLKSFITDDGDYKFIRLAVQSIVDEASLEPRSQTPSAVSIGKRKMTSEQAHVSSACIPFIGKNARTNVYTSSKESIMSGVYLSQLRRCHQLPDLIDPTSPTELVNIDPVTGQFSPPALPEVFSALRPLPSFMSLEPLVNVHKQRKIAGVIKSFVTGQHLASRVHFEIDSQLFQRCLRMRGLDAETLQQALAANPS